MVRDNVAGGDRSMAVDQIKLARLSNKYLITYDPVSGNIDSLTESVAVDSDKENVPESILDD